MSVVDQWREARILKVFRAGSGRLSAAIVDVGGVEVLVEYRWWHSSPEVTVEAWGCMSERGPSRRKLDELEAAGVLTMVYEGLSSEPDDRLVWAGRFEDLVGADPDTGAIIWMPGRRGDEVGSG